MKAGVGGKGSKAGDKGEPRQVCITKLAHEKLK